MRNDRPSILITGFGPFPGHPCNASSVLAERLAAAAAPRLPRYTIRAETLPTEWQAGPGRLAQLIGSFEPAIALHFGISRRAKGFVVETRARNIAARSPDAIGALPAEACISKQDPAVLASTWPASRIVARLRRIGLPAVLSHDAGSYLCNAVLYRSLAEARSMGPAALTRRGFVHIPSGLTGRDRDGRLPTPACQLDWNSAILGGLEILAACLGGGTAGRV
jgi:pyroglutamyl-peptidase